MKNNMKMQKTKFIPGDIITNARTEWKRLVREVIYIPRSGMMKVMYAYSIEELDDHFQPTGGFYNHISGFCSQDHLLRWQAGQNH